MCCLYILLCFVSLLEDYLRALQMGVVKVAYARVILYGPGGVGKSSLLKALMNLSLLPEAYSTQMADIFYLRPFWAHSKEGGYWTEVSDEDELEEIVRLMESQQAQWEEGSSVVKTSSLSSVVDSNSRFDHPGVKAFIEKIMDHARKQGRHQNRKVIVSDVYLHVWDCGGQRIFLSIIPAFLTSRTLFISVFDASRNLQGRCLSISHYKGQATEELEEMTTFQFLLEWMSSIHATLFKKKKGSKESFSPKYPRIMPVGTHGDHPSVRENKGVIMDELKSECANKAFAHLVLDGVIVDNTTAGKGALEDSAFQMIRDAVYRFASEDMAVDTPITWVLFRKMFQRYAKNKPVIPLEEVIELAKACSIPEDTLTSVLKFYHDLAVFFHYSNVPSLESVVIANPQWFIKQIAKLLALEGFEEVKNDSLWRPLRERGVLVQPLYEQVLGRENKLKPQAIIDLLEDFLILSPIRTHSKVHPFEGLEYFVPSMLPRCTTALSQASTVTTPVPSLHLIFSTNYVPPGYFTRMATVISMDECCHIGFDEELFRNKISFRFGSPGQEIDKLTITREKSSIKVDVEFTASRPEEYPSYLTVCSTCHKTVKYSIKRIAEWFPGIEVSLALKCYKCPKGDFIVLPAKSRDASSDTIMCQSHSPSQLNSREYIWFILHQVYNLTMLYIIISCVTAC